MKKEYDFAFSLGFSCACSESLRAEGLQFASCPFDWCPIEQLDAANLLPPEIRRTVATSSVAE